MIESNSPEELQAEVERLRQENKDLLKAIYALTDEQFPFSREEVLAEAAIQPDFLEFIKSLETQDAQ
jgi:cell division protein FtsB